MMNEEYSRIVHTNLFSEKAKEVLDSVLGQLSDGWGENSPRYEIYWRFARVERLTDGEVVIAISSKEYKFDQCANRGRGKMTDNAFRNMTDFQVKEFFAKMIKNTAMRELRYCNNTQCLEAP